MPAEWQNTAWRKLPTTYTWLRPRCRHCEQTRRDHLKNLNRHRVKARNTIGAHARRYADKWGCTTREARRRLEQYGWNQEVISEMFDIAKRTGICKPCKWQYDFGDHEMTLDVNDPDSLPILETNTSVICRTCNTRKQSMTLVEWNEYQAYVRAITNGDIAVQLAIGL